MSLKLIILSAADYSQPIKEPHLMSCDYTGLKRVILSSEPTDTSWLLLHPSELHFASSDAACYAQIIALYGVEPDEALLLSDKGEERQAAQALGLAVHHHEEQIDCGQFSPHFRLQPTMIQPQWRGNLAAIRQLLQRTLPHQWPLRPNAQEWSILQILSHLIESEDRHQRPRLQRIQQEIQPFIIAPEPPGPNQAILDSDAWKLLDQLEASRAQTLVFIQALRPDEWSRTARHSIFGLTTLLEMAHFTAQHDRIHIQQLCQAIGRCQD